jgi:hypothetical protein
MAVMVELCSSEIQMGITPYTFTCKLNEGDSEGEEVKAELWVCELGWRCSGVSTRRLRSLQWRWSLEKREQRMRKENYGREAGHRRVVVALELTSAY